MTISENYSLERLNTFRVRAKTRFFAKVENKEDVFEIINNSKFKNIPKFILGEGSNTLFTEDFNGLIIRPFFSGKNIIEEDNNNVLLEIGAGENWHELVTYAVNNNWGGIENLALVPGTAGAAPVQNIACYGQNFSDVFDSLEAIDLESGEMKKFNIKDCRFGYRDSIFKKLKGKYIIVKIKIKLLKNPNLETSYYQIGISHDSVKEELKKIATSPYTIRNVYEAVINIRQRKLPDPAIIPTAGSFFLNPVISKLKFQELRETIPELQGYPLDQLHYKSLDDSTLEKDDFVKVAAGRLLEKIGWLGKWIGNCGIHNKHALIVITNGQATGKEILDFSEEIRKDFLNHCGFELQREVNIV